MGRVKKSGVGGLFPSFALAPTLRVTVFTLPNLPPSQQRWRLQQYEQKQAACTAGYK